MARQQTPHAIGYALSITRCPLPAARSRLHSPPLLPAVYPRPQKINRTLIPGPCARPDTVSTPPRRQGLRRAESLEMWPGSCRAASEISAPGDVCRLRKPQGAREVQLPLDTIEMRGRMVVSTARRSHKRPSVTERPVQPSSRWTGTRSGGWHDAGWRRLHPNLKDKEIEASPPRPLSIF